MLRKNICSIFYLVLIFTNVCLGQQAKIQGQIRSEDKRTPLAGINVYLEGTDYGAVTNGNGFYRIQEISTGPHKLIASCIGYAPFETNIDLSEGEALKLDFELLESSIGLPTVVVSSNSLTGGLKGLREVPGSAHYLSPKEIEKFSYTDINRTLRAVPGVNLQEEDGFGLRPNIGLRGTGAERSAKITLMEDGILAAPAPYSAPAAYYFPTIGRIHAVEVLKGSSQIRFGPYTTGGAINLISTPIPTDLSARISLLGGSFGNRNLHANVGNTHKNLAYLVETFQFHSNGFKELDKPDDTGFDKKDYLAKFRVNTNPDARIYQSITFKIGQAQETSSETYLGLTAKDYVQNPYRRYAASQNDKMETDHQQYSIQHLITLSESIDITTTAYRNSFHRNWYKLDKVINSSGRTIKITNLLDHPSDYPEAYGILQGASSINEDALQLKANNRSYLSKGIQTNIGLDFKGKNISHTLDIGMRYHFDEVDRFQWIDKYKMEEGNLELTEVGTPGTESNRIEQAIAFATYLQYKIQSGKWTFIPGLRYENIKKTREDYGKNDPERIETNLSQRENQVGVFIPGVGFNYELNEQANIFGGIHKGFSPPDSKAETEAEKSINYELGLRYNKKALSGEAILFYNDYDNLLGTDLAAVGGAGNNELFNGGEVKTQGLEFQLSYDLFSNKKANVNLPLSLVYTFTDAAFQNSFESTFEAWGNVEEGYELPYIAKHQMAFLAGINGLKFAANMSARYQSVMRTVAGQGGIPENEKTDPYLILDINASYFIHKNVALFGSVNNLQNKVYIVARRPAGLRPGMPRAFTCGIKANL